MAKIFFIIESPKEILNVIAFAVSEKSDKAIRLFAPLLEFVFGLVYFENLLV